MDILHSDKPYQDLANAIIVQAAQDYRRDLKALKRGYRWELAADKEEIERFFHSQWFSMLTTLDPDYLLERLKEEAEDDENNG
jgi:hypothetical protein